MRSLGPQNLMRRLILIGIFLGIILPLAPLLIWSFSFRWYYPSILPEELSLRAWAYIGDPLTKVPEAFLISFLIAVTVTLLAALLGIPAGRALGLADFRGKTVVELILLAPALVPSLGVLMGLQQVFLRLGLADRIVGVVLAHLLPALPYMVLTMTGIFANHDFRLEHQARTLGAGPGTVFFKITLPMIAPGLAVGGLFTFLISWSQYVLTLLIGGGRVITLPVLLFAFARSGDNAISAALCLLFLVPALVILGVTSRFLTKGTTVLGGWNKI